MVATRDVCRLGRIRAGRSSRDLAGSILDPALLARAFPARRDRRLIHLLHDQIADRAIADVDIFRATGSRQCHAMPDETMNGSVTTSGRDSPNFASTSGS